jgi:hypothetical protein
MPPVGASRGAGAAQGQLHIDGQALHPLTPHPVHVAVVEEEQGVKGCCGHIAHAAPNLAMHVVVDILQTAVLTVPAAWQGVCVSGEWVNVHYSRGLLPSQALPQGLPQATTQQQGHFTQAPLPPSSSSRRQVESRLGMSCGARGIGEHMELLAVYSRGDAAASVLASLPLGRDELGHLVAQ